jgi:hypothetical protein
MTESFIGRGEALTDTGFEAASDLLGVRAAEIWAVLSVETRGCGFFADRRPLLLFERHIFSRETSARWDATHPDVSHARAGGYTRGAQEYGRLARALALDREAALASASWGIGQVMGFNCKKVGYFDAASMVKAMTEGEDAQLLAMATFVDSVGLAPSLRAHNWASFARGYNGPAYARNEYDARLAGAYARFTQGVLPDLLLRKAQVLLMYLGYEIGPIDGLMGRFTRTALEEFQEREGLVRTGESDEPTLARLCERVGLC